ncbi:MAG: PD40 domain-containing protein, partial [Anaerolineales bacterium]|nr:PD40 domain-containing protein [Anaerolineales bacterium]
EDVGALEVKISDVSQEARLYTWATWKNSSERVGINEVAQEETRTPDLIFQLDSAEKVRTDATGDVPFSNYDITNVAFKDFTSAFKVTFYTLEDMGPVGSGDYLDLRLYIDRDCNVETGQIVNGIGSDFYIRYRHDRGQAQIRSWDENEETWQSVTAQLQVENLLGDKRVGVWVPYDILNLENEKQFCWRALSRNYREEFASGLPTDYVTPPSVLTLAPSGELPPAALPIVSSTEGTFIDIGDTWQYLPGSTESDPNWPNVDFDDSHWLSGPTGIGYGTGKLATDLDLITNDIQDSSSSTFVEHTSKETGVTLITLSSGADSISLYTRRAFTVTSPLTQLMLEIDYKDGFVAYLNGTEVARRGFEDGLPINYDTFATQREANTVEIIDLSDYISELRTDSPNVLAIQVHRSVDVPLNLFVAPKLIWHYTSQHTNVEQKDDNSAVNTDLIPSVPTPPLLSLSDISGKLAVPILDEYEANYNTHVYSVPNGEEIDVISYARQPNFHPDGQRLLINREGGGVENVFEYNIETEIDKPVSDSPNDWHPFYDPWGNRVVYGNDQLAMSGIPVRKIENGEVQRHNKTGEIIYKGVFAPFIFVQCSINPPHLEEDALCRDIAVFDVLIPAGQMGDLQGTHPVWTSNDLIAFKGCNSWAGSQLCGIFTVPSASTKRLSNGFIPKQLTRDTSDTPSDTKGNFITFTSQRDGDWEAYIMDLNGNGLQNLSNSPESNDGIPTISPDQQWVAFVSDRGGQWAIWAVPSSGGTPQKLFDLPTNSPWGDQDLSWLTERISWGP